MRAKLRLGCMWAEFAKDRVITLSVRKFLKRVLPTSEETGLGEAMTRSTNESIQKVKEYNKINYTIVPIAIAMKVLISW